MGAEEMNRQEIEKLLGGYATGTLTPAEEQALMAAALEDQQLFDALANEQPLRELLRDPSSRASLLASLADAQAVQPWWRVWARPMVAVAAVLCIAAGLALWQARRHPAAAPVLTAVRAPAPALQVVPEVKTVQEPPPPPRSTPRPVRKAQAKPAAPPEVTTAEPAAPPVVVAEAAAPKTKAEPSELKTGSHAETIEVTAQPAAPQNAPRFGAVAGNGFVDGGGGGGSAVPGGAVGGVAPVVMKDMRAKAAMAMVAAVASRAKWTLLRRQPDGGYVAVTPAVLKAGDAVKLRLESADTGFVYVAEKDKLLGESAIEAGKPFELAIDPPQGPGEREIEYWFSPRQTIWRAAASAGRQQAQDAAGPHPPSVHITLRYK